MNPTKVNVARWSVCEKETEEQNLYIIKLNMNKIKLAVIGIVSFMLIGFGINSCNNEPDAIQQLDIPKEYTEVGILHNEGLDYIFEGIKAQAIESVKNPSRKRFSAKEDYSEFIKQTTLDFCKQNKKLQKDLDVCEQSIESVLTDKRSSKSLKSAISEEITPDLQELLDAINAVLSKEFKKDELSLLKAQLDGINRRAAETLPEKDAIVVYCTTSTAYSSYQYWMENSRKWFFALNYPEILEQYQSEDLNQLKVKNNRIERKGFWDDLWNTTENWYDSVTNALSNWWDNGGRTIVTQDAGGATFGAIAGAAVGSWTGPGTVGTAALGAAAAGLGASGQEAMTQWLDSL
jgi:ElaB/YqjD/DUF883 family membrane-anchored ribosome-binding protein